ncbi:hypothetical protein CKAH01_08363 [Colletotrichum kahawae]|uniref:Uncharacterized protein n=2 Tax=Colletotrichum kahawae TaxID=34407 RepID=A0AAD9Y3Z6_COLKA|nr:hypothetical protein CKAH01_08363 [Colletotrichum kahawae]
MCIIEGIASLNLGLPYVANGRELRVWVDVNSLPLPSDAIVDLGLEELYLMLGGSQLHGLLLEAFLHLSKELALCSDTLFQLTIQM